MPYSLDTSSFAAPAVPPELIRYTCGYDDFENFLTSGAEVKLMFDLALENYFGAEFGNYENILDFGCGCGRIARYIRAPRFFGCDIHGGCVSYCKANLEHADFHTNDARPPLIFRENLFNLIYSFSVFSHLDADLENAWLEELARVGAPSCVYLLTVHGDWMIEQTLEPAAKAVAEAGFFYRPVHNRNGSAYDFPDYYEASYHTSSYIRREWSRFFDIIAIVKGDQPGRHLGGAQTFAPEGDVPLFRPMGQDLVIARKRLTPSSATLRPWPEMRSSLPAS